MEVYGFHGHPCPELGHNSWELLRRLRGLSSVPWVCSGDFNGAISMEEKKEGMDKTLADCALADIGFLGPRLHGTISGVLIKT